MSLFSALAWVPKMACTMLPTSITPAAQGLQPRLVDLAFVGDLHPEAGDAGVDVDQVLPATEGGDQLLGLGVGERPGGQCGSAARGPGGSAGRAGRTGAVGEVRGLLRVELVLRLASRVRMFHRLITKRNRK